MTPGATLSFNTHRNRLRTLFRFAVSQGWLEKNPTDRLLLAPAPSKLHKTLSQQSIAKIVGHLQQGAAESNKSRFWLLVTHMLYWTGMRRRQLSGLAWRDIDWDDMSIRLSAENSKTRKEWIIPMTTNLQSLLEELHGWTTEASGMAPDGDDQVFNIKVVQTILGHSDVKTTCGYIQPDRASMLAALSRIPSFPRHDTCQSGIQFNFRQSSIDIASTLE